MNIVYVSNENYVRHLAVSVVSLLENNEAEEEIKIYVISTGISELSKTKLNKLVHSYQREIEILNLADLKDRFDYPIDTGKFVISIMGRLFVGELLPEEVERVLYLDCDTVVCKNLHKLYTMDLDGKILGAAMEPTINPEIREDAGIAMDAPYFNSGVLLIDLKKWRQKNARNRVLYYHETIERRSLFSDQDAINGALRWEIKIIDPQYNFFSNYRYWKYEELVKMSKVYRLIPKKMYERAMKHPSIVHFAGDERPWLVGNRNYYRKVYQKYKKLTPWADRKDIPGKRMYMYAYHGMNVLTLISPWARRQISTWYIQGQIKKKGN